jgi:hypothetical protein
LRKRIGTPAAAAGIVADLSDGFLKRCVAAAV